MESGFDNDSVFISVVIPIYNRASLIEATIESVLLQTIENKIEVIVVDDGSTDDSAEVVNGINDPRIRYIYQKNAGAPSARNTGIDAARGRYIAFLDSDDKFLPNHLASAKSALQKKPNVVTYGRIIVDRGNGKALLKPPKALQLKEHMSEYLLCGRGFLQTSTIVIPTELAKRVQYKVGLPYGQDTDFAIRLFASGSSFHMIDEPVAIWRDLKDENRVSSKFTAPARLKWLESVEPYITKKAFYGDRGWVVAKSYARTGKLTKALGLFFKAVIMGCYKPSLAAVIFFQIILPDNFFRKTADAYIKIRSLIFQKPVLSKTEPAAINL